MQQDIRFLDFLGHQLLEVREEIIGFRDVPISSFLVDCLHVPGVVDEVGESDGEEEVRVLVSPHLDQTIMSVGNDC